MSLQWSNSVSMRVGPQTVAATLRRPWPRRATLAAARRVVDATLSPQADKTGPAPARSGLGTQTESIASVLRELEQAAPLRGANLTVELSDALVHLDVITGDFAGHNDRQLHAIANACVSELLGEDAGEHEVRWQLQSDDAHLLISAIPRSHLSVLAQAAAACGLRLGSVQPDFVRQWNAHAGALKSGPAVFAVTTGANLAIAWVVDGVISAFSVGPLFEPIPEAGECADDRALAAEQLDSRVGELLLGLGLNRHTRRAFSPSHPSPLDSVEMLDARVDRLLAGMGQDPSAQSAFVLVAPEASPPHASQRWTVLGQNGRAA